MDSKTWLNRTVSRVVVNSAPGSINSARSALIWYAQFADERCSKGNMECRTAEHSDMNAKRWIIETIERWNHRTMEQWNNRRWNNRTMERWDHEQPYMNASEQRLKNS